MKFDFDDFESIGSFLGDYISEFVQSAIQLVTSENFIKGALASGIPLGILLFFVKEDYKKQLKELKEKQRLLKEKLREHEAIIKELSKQSTLTKERQDRLLQYDSKLKEEIRALELEIEDLKNEIAELKGE